MLDILIVGGGMVGASVALKLSRAGMQVGLIEKLSVTAFDPQSTMNPQLNFSDFEEDQDRINVGFNLNPVSQEVQRLELKQGFYFKSKMKSAQISNT